MSLRPLLRASLLAAAAALVIPATLSGCAELQKVLESSPKPTATVSNVSIGDISMEKAQLIFDLDVRNPYGFALPVSGLDYSLASGGKTFLTGQQGSQESIPARGTGKVKLPVEVTFASLLDAVSGIKPGAVVPYEASLKLSADAPGIGPVSLPMNKSGKVPVPAVPDIKVSEMKWDTLSFNEAKATLKLDIANTNAFPVDLSALDYALSLGGTRIARGNVAQKVSFQPGGSGTVEIPVSLSPARLGMGVFNILKGDSANYTLDGTYKLDTEFGPLGSTFKREGVAKLTN